MTFILFAVIGLLLWRLKTKSRADKERNDTVEMQPPRESDERAGTCRGQEELADRSTPLLYQTLGENRFNPSEKTYTSLCDVSREHNQSPCTTPNADRTHSPNYENVNETKECEDVEYEIVSNA